MKYKDGVFTNVTKVVNGQLTTLIPSNKILYAMSIADNLSKQISNRECVVTSLLDGVHSKNSLHYIGQAFDLRIWIYNESQINSMLSNLKTILGSSYDVILEEDHIHVEYDPK